MRLLLWLGLAAWAHPLDLGLLRVVPELSGVSVELRLNDELVRTLLSLQPGLLSAPVLQSRADELKKLTLASGSLAAKGIPCTWGPAQLEIDSSAVVLKASAACGGPPEQVTWQWPFLNAPTTPETFRLLARVESPTGELVLSADKQHPELNFETGSELTFGRAIHMGMEHIGATPGQWKTPEGWRLPDGLDHILFVVALILGGGGIVALLKTITGFTVGHSITLALCALRVVQPPFRLVESLIALSIALVAWEAFRGKHPERRWKWSTAFGLIHGFGFGAALLELNLSGRSMAAALVGFNVGVELGQLVLIAVLVPLVTLAARNRAWPKFIQPALACLILLAGGYWFVQRAFGF